MRIKLHTHLAKQAVGAVLAATLTGCTDAGPAQKPSSASSAAGGAVQTVTDEWLGRWIGPEGTYLDIQGGSGRYELTVANLDGPKKYKGQAEGESIVFQRDGRSEVVRATDGDWDKNEVARGQVELFGHSARRRFLSELRPHASADA